MSARRKITSLIALMLCCWGKLALAATVDTLLTGNGTAGPYFLGSRFIAPSTLKVAAKDSAAPALPAWHYIDSLNAISFAETIDSGRVLAVGYSTAFYGLSKTYSLFTPMRLDTADTAARASSVLIIPPRRLYSEENLTVSGYKSIGVAMGNGGQMNLEQALDVRIFGDIAPQTELSANLSDQGTSLDGATRELGEIDMIYLTLTNPRYQATVGDQYITMPAGGLLYGQKKIKGISLGLHGPQASSSLFGAISGGKYAVQTVRGQLGFQGPYTLRGQGEADLINPVSGTVKVSLDGRNLREGGDADYTVDYDLGTISFTPACPLNDDQIIRIEYEYKSFDYQRMTFGTSVSGALADSTLVVDGSLWCDLDNKNHPIELALDRAVKDSLSASGDRPLLQPNGRRIHPNDVERRNALYPLYRIDTAAAGRRIYTYVPTPTDSQEVYLVWFKKVGAGTGDYVQDSTLKQARTVYFYTYAGPGQGDYSCLSPFPAPTRSTVGQMGLVFKPRPWFELSSQVAGEEKDLNLFSSRDDRDNAGATARSSFVLGRRAFDKPAWWLSGSHTYIGRRFTQEILSEYDRKERWDREQDTVDGGERNFWESGLGATFTDGVSSEFSYGQFIRDREMLTWKAANATRVALGDRLFVNYDAGLFRHADRSANTTMNSNGLGVRLEYDKTSYRLHLEDEWRFGGLGPGRGSAGGGVEFALKPINLTESVAYTRSLKGDRFWAAADTSSLLSWTQGLRHSPLPGWTLSANSSFQYRRRPTDTLSTLLVNAINDLISARSGLSMHQEYTVTSEKASSFVQIPVFAGQGLGSYSFDSTAGEYVPDGKDGGYLLEEREVYDTTGRGRTQKTLLRGNWSLWPPVARAPDSWPTSRWAGPSRWRSISPARSGSARSPGCRRIFS
jgi:hypothetical protein